MSTPPINLNANFGKNIKDLRDFCNENHLTITDTNEDGIFDKSDKLEYQVQKGDNLTKIARKYDGYSLGQLIKANQEQYPNADLIKPGDSIIIPLEEKPKNTTPPQKTAKPAKINEEYKFETRDFGNIKTRKVIDERIQKLLKNETVESLKNGKFYVDDKNGNGIFDKDDGLYKQVSIMLDAGHDNRLREKQKVSVPGKGIYTTKENDSYESIAKTFGVSANQLREANYKKARTKDPGAPGPDGGLTEADINGIARDELAKKLKSEGFDVILAERTDKAHLIDRQKEKLEKNPDIYISIHCNSNTPGAEGEEVHYREKEDKDFAETISSSLTKDPTFQIRKRPLVQGKYIVLGGDTANRTAEALVELGYMSDDYTKLADKTSRGKQLDAISDGIKNYYTKHKEK